MGKKQVYNINEMRPALIKAFKDGNKRCINAKLCEELKITEGYFNVYLTNIENLYNAINNYVRVKHSPNTTAEAVKTAYEQIFPLWKNALECGEKEKNAKDFHVELLDVEDLVGFCQRFSYSSNAEGATKAWTNETFSAFRRKVETMLGIKIAGVEVLSDAKREWLNKERGLMSSIRHIEGDIKNLENTNKYLTDRVKKKSSKAVEAFVKEDIDANNQKINALKIKLETKKSELEAHRLTSAD